MIALFAVFAIFNAKQRPSETEREHRKRNELLFEIFRYYSQITLKMKFTLIMLAPVNCEIRNSNSNVTDETYNSKHLEILSRFELEKLQVSAEICLREKTPPPVPVNHLFNNLETWHTYSGGDTLTFHSNQPTPYLPWVQSN